jgi:hypothetical protein
MSDEQTTQKQRPQKGESNKFTWRDVTNPMPKYFPAEVSLTLTDAEREAVAYFATFHGSPREADAKHGKTLRSLLERTKQDTTAG